MCLSVVANPKDPVASFGGQPTAFAVLAKGFARITYQTKAQGILS
jgi:hypothetical protein